MNTNKSIIRIGAMIAIGVGVILVVVSVRDLWRSSATIAHASNDASYLVAVPTAVAGWQPAPFNLPVNSSSIVEVK